MRCLPQIVIRFYKLGKHIKTHIGDGQLEQRLLFITTL
jgi:hypothetical protein